MNLRIFVLSVALSLTGMADAAVDRLPPDGVLVEGIPASTSGVHADRLYALVQAGRIDDVLAALHAIADPVQRESTTAALLHAAQQGRIVVPDQLLDAIDTWPVRVYRRHDETAADWFVPVYDLPGQVQSIRRLRARDAEVDALLAAVAGKRGDASAATLAAAAPQVAALAVAALPPAAFAELAAQAKASPQPLPSPALAAIARRATDADTMLQAIDHAAPLDVLPLFADTLSAMSSADAERVVAHALTLPDYASAAAFALVRRTPAQEIGTLHEHLSDPATGTSIAAALAQQPDAMTRIDALLVDANNAATLTHLALALRLHGSDAATQRLHALRDDPRLPIDVRKELQR